MTSSPKYDKHARETIAQLLRAKLPFEPIWIGHKRPNLQGLRPADTSEYLMKHGTLYRAEPKRDKSISPRQWKKQQKALRRAALVAG